METKWIVIVQGSANHFAMGPFNDRDEALDYAKEHKRWATITIMELVSPIE